ncbi:MAG: serine/threonine protein kinase [Phycisphaerae bacterium]|nr:serine/threonine protein kinase [Phycisphaerae bacterium]
MTTGSGSPQDPPREPAREPLPTDATIDAAGKHAPPLHAADTIAPQRIDQPPVCDGRQGSAPSPEPSVSLRDSVAAAIRAAREKSGEWIGPYLLVEPLGEGGFGAVWHAERREPYVQHVALKLIRAGMDSESVLLRFEQERQALALMDHPNIARVLDGGVTPSGRPWFAMEFVKGEPITAYCERHCLGLHERLELFLQVCDAVQHAHMRGIIHRDLKPANILVSERDGAGAVAKVIDFGIAKALSSRLADHGAQTGIGQMIGTPEYMSPEQAEPDATDIDTRADVFALGVVLYELLVGATPFDPKVLRAQGFQHIQRTIREVDPPSPSVRLTTLARQDPEMRERMERAMRRRIDELARHLRSELELIPLKAMRKQREDRYASASDLALDVRNYLCGRPLLAVPESRAYRARKWVRRHRGLVAGASAVLIALVMGLIVSLVGWREAALQRTQAERRERDATRVMEFMTQTLAGANPMDGGSADVSLADALDDAVRRLDTGELAGHLESEAALRLEVARVLRGQGDPARAAALAQQSAHLFLEFEGPSPSVAAALTEQGLALLDQDAAAAALPVLMRALEINEQALGKDAAGIVGNLASIALAQAALGQVDRAIALHERALSIAVAAYPEQHAVVAACMGNLGDLLATINRLDEAESLLARSLQMRESLLGGAHPDVAEAQNNLAMVRWERGQRGDADRLFNLALANYDRSYGPAHEYTRTVLESLRDLHREWEAAEPGKGHAAAADSFERRLHTPVRSAP